MESMNTGIVQNRGDTPLYEEVAAHIASLVEKGTFRPGDRIPSIRALSRQVRVSVNTVKEAYGLLEDRRVIEARPQSGYYVRARLPEIPAEIPLSKPEITPSGVSHVEMIQMVLRDTLDAGLVQFGCAIPNPDLLPVEKLTRILSSECRRYPKQSVSYAVPPGCDKLRTQIAKRMVLAGCSLHPSQIVTTNGCSEAVMLALQAVCTPGGTVAVETPVYFNFLQIIEALGLRALEIPGTSTEGMSLEALRYALDHNSVQACLVITNFSNPLGALMPDQRKRELVALLANKNIPLIEDDIYGDLSFVDQRPSVAKAWDRTDNVLLCSSFSKTLAPGYRVGWIAPGRYQTRIEQLKMVINIASPAPTQLAVAEFLANGGYEHYLRTVRRIYARNLAQMGDAIGRFFPEGTRVSRPSGGFSLWVELPEEVDTLRLYSRALKEGITLAPGQLFSASGKYGNFVRVNAAFWSERFEPYLVTLGRLANELATRPIGRGGEINPFWGSEPDRPR